MAAWKLGPALASRLHRRAQAGRADAADRAAPRRAGRSRPGSPRASSTSSPATARPARCIVDHPGIDKIAFTGSTAVGREIGAKAGRALKRVTLELGGKSPNIILPDADLEAAIKGAFTGIYFNSGQACNAATRLFVPKAMFDDVVGALAEQAKATTPGPGLDPKTFVGPLVSAEQHDRVRGYIDAGKAEAELVAGGGDRPDGDGYFVEPTLFTRDRRRRHDRARGDLRPGARRPALRDARGGRRARQRQRVRPRRGRLDAATSPTRTASPRCCAPARSTSTPGARRTRRRRSAASRPPASAASTATTASTPTSRPSRSSSRSDAAVVAAPELSRVVDAYCASARSPGALQRRGRRDLRACRAGTTRRPARPGSRSRRR